MTGKELKAFREKYSFTQDHLAKIFGLQHGRSIRAYEAGEREIDGRIVILVKAYEIIKKLGGEWPVAD